MFKAVLCVALIFAVSPGESEWTYTDQDAWGGSCSGPRQSPIDIISGEVAEKNLKSINFTNYDRKPPVIILLNVARAVRFTWNNPLPLISGGGLPGTYELFYGKFHWGEADDNKGSEHLIDGHQSALELQLYHQNTAYDSFSEAYDKPDGIAILSILYDVGPANEALAPLVANLPKIFEEPNAPIFDGSVGPLSSFLPSDTLKFYRYFGSETIPTCNETVTWTVFASRQTVSVAQLDEFRKMKDIDSLDPLPFNFRNVQSSPAITVIYSSGEENEKKKICGRCIRRKTGSRCVYYEEIED